MELPRELRGLWVAYRIEGNRVRVVERAATLEGLLARLRERGIDARFVFVDYVPDEDVELLLTKQTPKPV